jgi:hypothetical protein
MEKHLEIFKKSSVKNYWIKCCFLLLIFYHQNSMSFISIQKRSKFSWLNLNNSIEIILYNYSMEIVCKNLMMFLKSLHLFFCSEFINSENLLNYHFYFFSYILKTILHFYKTNLYTMVFLLKNHCNFFTFVQFIFCEFYIS